jgi:hypothetical protein
MSATTTIPPAGPLRGSDAIDVTRADGTTIPVSLDALRAFCSAAAVVPVKPPAAESKDPTVITTVGPMLTDAVGNTYAINAARQVVTNGRPETADGVKVTTIAYHQRRFWRRTQAGDWYYRVDPKSPYTRVQSTRP